MELCTAGCLLLVNDLATGNFVCPLPQGAVRGVQPYFPGLPPSHFLSTPEQMFYIQLTLGFFCADSLFVRGGPARVAVDRSARLNAALSVLTTRVTLCHPCS